MQRHPHIPRHFQVACFALLFAGLGASQAWGAPVSGIEEVFQRDRLLRFAGRLHPLLVHFPIGLLLVGGVLELVRRRERPSDAGFACLLFGTLFAALAAGCGWLYADYEGVEEGRTLFLHRWSGVSVAGLGLLASFFALILRRRPSSGLNTLYRLGLFMCVGVLVFGAHLGGRMVYGEGYLLEVLLPKADEQEDAPAGAAQAAAQAAAPEEDPVADPTEPLEVVDVEFPDGTTLLVEEELEGATPTPVDEQAAAELLAGQVDEAKTPGTEAIAAVAPVFSTDIRPLFERTCFECHGPTGRAKAGLRLASMEEMFAGESELWPLQPGDSAASELYMRITLPREHEDAMPPKGEPLSSAEVALVKLWIDQGAPAGAPVPDAEVETSASDAAAASGALAAGATGVELSEESEASSVSLSAAERVTRDRALAAIQAAGAHAGLVAQGLDDVDVNLGLLGTRADDAALALLQDLAPCLVQLDLSRSVVSDAGLASLAAFTHLRSLRLDNTAVGDAGLVHLAGLSELEVLNLFGTRVSNAGLETLSGMKSLKRVYLWQTAVTDAGVTQLAGQSPELEVIRDTYGPLLSQLEESQEMRAPCCDAAAAEDEACSHPCCVEAALTGVVCAECAVAVVTED